MKSTHRALLEKSYGRRKEVKAFLRKNSKNKSLDSLFHRAHESVFQEIDCLDCANCCKTTSPIFRDSDIRRIAKHLRMKEFHFVDTYLRLDSDQDYVLKESPCAFLNSDNGCSIYDKRPLACREYPHTHRKNMFQILDITQSNALICPAVASIMDKIMP